MKFKSLIKTINRSSKRICQDIICGHHSGFKPCCIAWFSLFWAPTLKIQLSNEKYMKYGDWYRDFTRRVYSGAGFPGYISCPKCSLLEDFVKVKKCNCVLKIRNEHGELSWKTILFDRGDRQMSK